MDTSPDMDDNQEKRENGSQEENIEEDNISEHSEENNSTQNKEGQMDKFHRNKSQESVNTEDGWTVVEKPKQLRIIEKTVKKKELTKKQRENQQKALKLKLIKQEQDE